MECVLACTMHEDTVCSFTTARPCGLIVDFSLGWFDCFVLLSRLLHEVALKRLDQSHQGSLHHGGSSRYKRSRRGLRWQWIFGSGICGDVLPID